MNLDVILLGLASAIRPSSVAAIYALLSREKPRRLLIAFFVAGFLFSATFGILVVAVLHGADLRNNTGETVNSLFQALLGAAALGFAAGVASGRLRPEPGTIPRTNSSRIATMLRNPSLTMAATAGMVTHVPGLFYILALSAILGSADATADAIVQVLLYNGIWVSVSVGALALYQVRPDATRRRLAALSAWALSHERSFVVPVFAAVGLYFLIEGLRGLGLG